MLFATLVLTEGQYLFGDDDHLLKNAAVFLLKQINHPSDFLADHLTANDINVHCN